MAKTEENGLTRLKNSQERLQSALCALMPWQKHRKTILNQGKPTPENPSQTRPIPIVANQLAPVSDLADRQSTRHSPSEGQACWVPEGSGQAVPTTRMLSYCQ